MASEGTPAKGDACENSVQCLSAPLTITYTNETYDLFITISI